MVDDLSPTSTNEEIEEKIPEAGSYRWVVICAFVACNTAGFLIANTIGILLPSITNEISLSPTEQGILSSAPFWANLTLMIVVSWWTSRYRPKLLVSVTMLLGALFLFVQGWAPTFLALFLGRLAFGVTMISREPARSLLIRQWLPQRETNMSGGISNLFFGIIVSGGLLLTPAILNYFDGNWRPTMNTFGAFFLVLGVIWQILGKERNTVKTLVPEPVGTSASEFSLVKKAFSFREIWIAGIGFTGAMMAFSSFNSFFPTMALNFYDVSLSGSGLISAMYVLPGGFSGVIVAYYLKGVRGRAPILALAGIIIASTYCAMTITGLYPLLIIFAVLNGIGWGFFPILYMVPFHLRGVQPREIAIAVAVVMSIANLGSSVGPALAGYMQESLGSLQISLRIISLAPLTLVIAAVLLGKKK
jgi:MFS family permease